MLRIVLSWRKYVDQFAYTRQMLVRVQRLKFVQKCFVAWWLSVKREVKLRIIFRTIDLRLAYRRFRLWALMTLTHRKAKKVLRLCWSNWRFYIAYKLRLYQEFANLIRRSKMITAATKIQARWRAKHARKEWKARKKIFKGLFWNTKLWRRVYRARMKIEARRLEKEEAMVVLVASRTILAIKEYLLTLEGAEEFHRFRQKLDKHYREYDLDFRYDEKKNAWLDVQKPHEIKIDRIGFLPPILKAAAKDLIRNAGDLVNAVVPPLFDKVKAYRIIEDRCVRDIKKKGRALYRRKHPPPFYCTKCNKTFMFKIQLDSHEKHSAQVDCTPKEFKNQGYAWYMAGDFTRRIMDTVLKVFFSDLYGIEE
jgi:hypothetical protein